MCGLTGLGLGSGFLTTPHASVLQWELVESLLCARLCVISLKDNRCPQGVKSSEIILTATPPISDLPSSEHA